MLAMETCGFPLTNNSFKKAKAISPQALLRSVATAGRAG